MLHAYKLTPLSSLSYIANATYVHCFDGPFCNRLRRFITILYYLNDVKEGGETAFPVADNATMSSKVEFESNAYD